MNGNIALFSKKYKLNFLVLAWKLEQNEPIQIPDSLVFKRLWYLGHYCTAANVQKNNHKTKLVFIEISFWYGYRAEGMAAVSNHGYEGICYFMADMVNCYW